MSDPNKTTINPLSLQRRDKSTSGAVQVPCIEILFHYDLSLVGAITHPQLFKESKSINLGRLEPDFFTEGPSSSAGRSLEDPCISRQQVGVRYHKIMGGVFELRPTEAVTPVVYFKPETLNEDGVLTLAQGQPLVEPTLVEPGTRVAIGDRALLWLTIREAPPSHISHMGMVGESPGMWKVRTLVETVARLERPALVHGETGTGKELVARAIHESGPRKDGPFIILNCGAIPEHLVESMLFGHRRGAFTGATDAREGVFKAADGGSLFLDEIGELSLQIQQKLLRVLQEGTFMPVGSSTEQRVNVRVIAATHRDLAALARSGEFREDLYYRLAAHLIEVPALRERIGDVPRLFVHFLERKADQYEELQRLFCEVEPTVPPIPLDFFLELMSQRWSGNVRHLQNSVDRLVQLNLHDDVFIAPSLSEPGTRRADDDEALQTIMPPMRPAQASDFASNPSMPAVAVRSSPSLPVPSVANPDAPLPAEFLRLQNHLSLSTETLSKLLPDPDPSVDMDALLVEARQELHAMLDRYDYNQTHTAKALDVSRKTLIRLMKTLGFVRAKDLSREQILDALETHDNDIDSVSQALRISRRGLQLRISQLNIEL